MKKYTIKLCINIEFVKDPTDSQKSISQLSASVAQMTDHLNSAKDVAEYINKPQEEQKFPLEAILKAYYGDEVEIYIERPSILKTVYKVPFLTIIEERINPFNYTPIFIRRIGM